MTHPPTQPPSDPGTGTGPGRTLLLPRTDPHLPPIPPDPTSPAPRPNSYALAVWTGILAAGLILLAVVAGAMVAIRGMS